MWAATATSRPSRPSSAFCCLTRPLLGAAESLPAAHAVVRMLLLVLFHTECRRRAALSKCSSASGSGHGARNASMGSIKQCQVLACTSRIVVEG
jgi:hypothetical protein